MSCARARARVCVVAVIPPISVGFPSVSTQNLPPFSTPGSDELMDRSRTTEFELVFLGTSSAAPTLSRNVTSLALKLAGEAWVFDAGEATQVRRVE